VIALPDLNTWIANSPETSEIEESTFLHDPNTEAPLQRVRSSSNEQVDRAVARADEMHRSGEWQALGVVGRAPHLSALADAIDGLADQIASLDALNSGVPISFTRMFAATLGGTIRSAVQLAVETGDRHNLPADQGAVELRRIPWGPTALIVPWNAPAALAVKKTAFALVAGAPVVLKPSPASPSSAELLACAVREAGLPHGVLGLVLGGSRVGAQLCGDPRVRAIAMTGATATGRQIARSAAPRFARLRLELGSNNPAVVRADASIPETAQHLFRGMTKLNGQWCEAPRNVYVHQDVAAALVDALGELAQRAELGSSLDTETEIGPMAFRERRDQLVAERGRWAAAGHKIIQATEPATGWFFAPTMVHGDGIAIDDEVFGPMLTVEAAADHDEAIRRANQSAGGLAAYVFGEDTDEALRTGAQLTAGEVKINGTSLLDMSSESAQSFFGDSGLGGHGDRDVLDFYSGKQIVGVDIAAQSL
jgi:phenylacetaldehyde dehydrogenase